MSFRRAPPRSTIRKDYLVRLFFVNPHRTVILSGCDFIDSLEVLESNRNCHPACPGLPWNRSEAQWRGLRFSVPSGSTLLTRATTLPFVILIRMTILWEN